MAATTTMFDTNRWKILAALARAHPGVWGSVRIIAENAGIPKTTAHRELKALVREGLATTAGGGDGYALDRTSPLMPTIDSVLSQQFSTGPIARAPLASHPPSTDALPDDTLPRRGDTPEADGRDRLFELAAQLIGVAFDDDGPLAGRMSRAFPWMLALSPNDRQACACALVDTARASFSTGQPHLVLAELTSWRETATALAAGLDGTEVEWLN